MYGGLAANEGVFATVKGIDGVISDMAKGMFEGIDNVDLSVLNPTGSTTYKKFSGEQAVNKTKHLVRELVGSEIMKYMNDHKSAFTKYEDDGTTPKGVDPVKYMNTFATAASKAMSSEKAAKNLEAVMYTLAMAKTFKQASDDMKDFRTKVMDWDDSILKEYGFSNSTAAGTFFDPYAFLDPTDISFDDILKDHYTYNDGTYTAGNEPSIIDVWNEIGE